MPGVVVVGWVAALTALLLWPLRHSGYLLGHDMVFTPRQPLSAEALGVSSAPPRAVPVDALVALAERVVGAVSGGALDGAVVGRVALLVPLLVAGLGVAALLESASLPARLAASGLAVWNPYLVERLALGQWSLLWGYAALPWLLRAVSRHQQRGRGRGRWHRLLPPLALASITPTGGLLGALVVVASSLHGGVGSAGARGRAAVAVLLAAGMQAPWVTAALLSGAAGRSDPGSVAAFASHGEYAGVVPSLLSAGGIWDADVVPPSRDGPLALVALLVVVVAAVLGWRRLRELLGGAATVLAGCALVGFVLALGSQVPGMSGVVRGVVSDLPGGGLLRDAQKWLAPLVVLEALLVGAAVDVLAGRLAGRTDHSTSAARVRRTSLGLAACALPLALLPDATTALWPTLRPVHYPAGYAVAARLTARGGDVAVVPFQPYRSFSWAGGRISLDPAGRLLDAPVVASDQLQVGDRVIAGEDPRAAAVATALAAGPGTGADLGRLGVGWVLVERRTPGLLPDLTSLQLVHADADVAVYRVTAPVADVAVAGWRTAVATAVLVAWLVAALGSAAAMLVGRGVAIRRAGRARAGRDATRPRR